MVRHSTNAQVAPALTILLAVCDPQSMERGWTAESARALGFASCPIVGPPPALTPLPLDLSSSHQPGVYLLPLCDIPFGCCFFMEPWTVTRSSLRMLRRVAAFCRPLRPVLLLVSFPRSRSTVVGVLGLCWMWQYVPFARQRRPVVGVWGLCWLLRGSFDCCCCPHPSVLRPSTTCLAACLPPPAQHTQNGKPGATCRSALPYATPSAAGTGWQWRTPATRWSWGRRTRSAAAAAPRTSPRASCRGPRT